MYANIFETYYLYIFAYFEIYFKYICENIFMHSFVLEKVHRHLAVMKMVTSMGMFFVKQRMFFIILPSSLSFISG